MSDTVELPITLAAFGATLRPQIASTATVRSSRPGTAPQTLTTYTPGHPDEIWLKLLAMRHGGERHTAADWQALIEQYRDEPAHPADPNYRP